MEEKQNWSSADCSQEHPRNQVTSIPELAEVVAVFPARQPASHSLLASLGRDQVSCTTNTRVLADALLHHGILGQKCLKSFHQIFPFHSTLFEIFWPNQCVSISKIFINCPIVALTLSGVPWPAHPTWSQGALPSLLPFGQRTSLETSPNMPIPLDHSFFPINMVRTPLCIPSTHNSCSTDCRHFSLNRSF